MLAGLPKMYQKMSSGKKKRNQSHSTNLSLIRPLSHEGVKATTYETIEYNNLISPNTSNAHQTVSISAKTKSKLSAFSMCANVYAQDFWKKF